MCNTARMGDKICILVANGVLAYSRVLGNLVADKDKSQTHCPLMGLQSPKWAVSRGMWTFVEADVVTRGKNGKLGDQELPMVFVGYVGNNSHDCYCTWNHALRKIIKSCDVIWLHRMYYQDDITANMAMLPEVCMNVYEIPNYIIAAMKLDGIKTGEAGRVDPVHDETEVEPIVSDDNNDVLPDLKVESEARAGGDDDVVTEASDCYTKQVPKTQSGRVDHMPKRYDGFKMTAVEI